MTISLSDAALYIAALFILFLTPGPVWVGLVARGMSGGFRAAWPLAIGVAVGDILWPLLAILGVTWVVSVFSDFILVLRWVACLTFIAMGCLVIRNRHNDIAPDARLTRPGMWAGFVAGLILILGNPKAILFYMGVLPGFFALNTLTKADVTAICIMSLSVPLFGNLVLSVFVDRARRMVRSRDSLSRLNFGAGILLIGVGLVIPLT